MWFTMGGMTNVPLRMYDAPCHRGWVGLWMHVANTPAQVSHLRVWCQWGVMMEYPDCKSTRGKATDNWQKMGMANLGLYTRGRNLTICRFRGAMWWLMVVDICQVRTICYSWLNWLEQQHNSLKLEDIAGGIHHGKFAGTGLFILLSEHCDKGGRPKGGEYVGTWYDWVWIG